jgi:hypothetical protein
MKVIAVYEYSGGNAAVIARGHHACLLLGSTISDVRKQGFESADMSTGERLRELVVLVQLKHY